MSAADRARFVATIRAQGDRLAEMIDKLLALAAVEHRQQIEHPRPVDLRAVAAEAVERVATRLARRRLSVRIDGPGAVVQGDPFLLRQALVNMLDNAADFAPEGSAIDVSIARDGPRWRVSVGDQGPGVPDYALARAFERFYSLPRPGGGSRSSGLGLCFVAQAASLHGGEASLANREGGGALATLSLPA